MKGRSCALEISVEISAEELLKLRTEKIEGVLRFEDWFSKPNIDRQISLSIVRDEKLDDFLSVAHEPKGEYLGHADKVSFGISNEYYEELSDRKEYGARYWGSGKLIMRVSG